MVFEDSASKGLLSVPCDLRYILDSSALQTAQGGIQDLLILPPFFARHRKSTLTANGRRKHIHLSGVGILIGDNFGLNHFAIAAKVEVDGVLDVEPVVGS